MHGYYQTLLILAKVPPPLSCGGIDAVGVSRRHAYVLYRTYISNAFRLHVSYNMMMSEILTSYQSTSCRDWHQVPVLGYAPLVRYFLFTQIYNGVQRSIRVDRRWAEVTALNSILSHVRVDGDVGPGDSRAPLFIGCGCPIQHTKCFVQFPY